MWAARPWGFPVLPDSLPLSFLVDTLVLTLHVLGQRSLDTQRRVGPDQFRRQYQLPLSPGFPRGTDTLLIDAG